MTNTRIDRPTRAFCMGRNSGWAPDGQIGLSDPTRRPLDCVRFNPSDKNSNPSNPLEQKGCTRFNPSDKTSSPSNPPGQKGCTQPCPNLGLDARARVQPNPTVTLLVVVYEISPMMPSTAFRVNKPARTAKLFDSRYARIVFR